jgi:hypothetical protein
MLCFGSGEFELIWPPTKAPSKPRLAKSSRLAAIFILIRIDFRFGLPPVIHGMAVRAAFVFPDFIGPRADRCNDRFVEVMMLSHGMFLG